MAESAEILEGLARIEQRLTAGLQTIQEELSVGRGFLEAVDETYRTRQEHARQKLRWRERCAPILERARRDPLLRFPHRRLIEALLDEYDDTTGDFRELHFSALVRRARVAKNRCNQYLTVLVTRGYVEARRTRYRNYYKIRAPDKLRNVEKESWLGGQCEFST